MEQERFEQLIAAYGADPARWPAAERAAAQRRAAERDLGDERALDALLDAYRVEGPSAALRQRVLAAAPGPRRAFRPTRLFWLSGAGLAAACAAGVLLGVRLGGAMASPGVQPDREAEAAAFGAVTVFGSPIELGRAG